MFVKFVVETNTFSMKRNTLLVLLSAALLSAGWLGLSGITLLVALVPLLIISERYSDSRRDWWRMCGWAALTFLLWSAATIWWVWIATPLGPITAGIVGTFWNLVAFMTYHYVVKRAPRALAYTLLVALWITTEYIYNSAEVMTFPWLLLGHGFSSDIWAVQWYEYTGIFGGTLWVLAANLAIFEVVRTRSKGARVRAAIITLVPILLSIGLYFGYTPSTKKTTISVIQPNVPCYEARPNDTFGDICRMMTQIPAEASFALMPESALEYIPEVEYYNYLDEYVAPTESRTPRALTSSTIDEQHTERLVELFTQMPSIHIPDCRFIIGASTMQRYGDTPATTTARHHDLLGYYDNFNSALYVDMTRGEVEQIYHKGKLVIGVEAVPLKGLFDLFEVDLGGVSGQLGWGGEHKVFDNNGVKIGPAICYEGLYGEYYAGFAKQGAEVMAIISNDGWWGNTPGHKRLFDFCRLRAIETRRAIARSANTGISGFISPRGDVVGDRLEWDEQGILTAEVELRDEQTIYTRYGDWVARISCFIAILSLLYYVAYRVRRRNHLVD